MTEFLSLVVPLGRPDAAIRQRVTELLEIAGELTSQFEIILVVDGSDDSAAENAAGLAREFPQLRVLWQGTPLASDEAIKAGLAAARGEFVIVQENPRAIGAAHLRQLWSLRHDQNLVMARLPPQPEGLSAEVIDRLSTWGQTLGRQSRLFGTSGLQMIRRDAAQALVAKISTSRPSRSAGRRLLAAAATGR